jgi:membrane fusion protein (multidrug efflux system)
MKQHSYLKQFLYGVCLVFLFALVLAGVKYWQITQAMAQAFGPAPEAVNSAIVAELDWEQKLSAVGTLEAVRGTTLRAELAGRVSKINFDSGARVTSGTHIIELDTAVEEAELRGAKARAERATQDQARAAALRRGKVNSQSESDQADAEAREASAQVAALEATIARKRIQAPFEGRLGIRQVSLGDYLNAGDPIIPLYSLDPLYLTMPLPQQYAGLVALGLKVQLRVDAFPERAFEATLTAIDPQLDSSTRSFRAQATVSNADELLRPGMFGHVEIVLPAREKVLAIPASGISYAPYGNLVYVIEPANPAQPGAPRKISTRIVELAEERGDLVAVKKGLAAGEEVVSSAPFKLRPDSLVLINNSAIVPALENPTIADT